MFQVFLVIHIYFCKYVKINLPQVLILDHNKVEINEEVDVEPMIMKLVPFAPGCLFIVA